MKQFLEKNTYYVHCEQRVLLFLSKLDSAVNMLAEETEITRERWQYNDMKYVHLILVTVITSVGSCEWDEGEIV